MLDGVRYQPSGISARCPSHADQVQSLSVNTGRDGGIVIKCHAGCPSEMVVGALGLSLGDLAGVPHVVATYDYHDETGALAYQVQRWVNPKTFRCVPGLPPPARRVLYQLDAVSWAREHDRALYVVEGEKDCDRLAQLGVPATTNVGGAGSWLDHYADQLAGCHVLVVADNDAPGRAHARAVATSVARTALTVQVAQPRYGNDVSDLLDAGWRIDMLDPLPEDDELGAIRAANVRVRPVLWAWDGVIPLGKVTIIEGDPGDGKSILSVDLVGRWTSGLADVTMPDGSPRKEIYNAVMITGEDDPEDTIVPRLMAARADLGRVEIINRGSHPDRPFDLSLDVPALYRKIVAFDAKIVFLDPLMAFVGEKTDSHNDASVRRALYPLYRLARDTGAAVLTVRHLNKGTGRAIYRGGGSIAFIGAARCAYAIGRDPDDRRRRIMACVKMNIAPEPPSLAYTVDNGPNGPYLIWHGPVDLDAQGVLDGDSRADRQDAVEFLNTVVQNGTPMAWKEIVAQGRKEGYSEITLRRIRPKSRLVKVVGSEGRRSTCWGYSEHLLAGDGASPPSVPSAPSDRLLTDRRDERTEQLDPAKLAAGDKESLDVDRDDELRALPDQCQICGSADAVKWFRPYWVVRCKTHNPLTYQGEGK